MESDGLQRLLKSHLKVSAFALWFMLIVSIPLSSESTGNVINDWPYVIKKHSYSEQSPVDICTKNATKLCLPNLIYSGYWGLNEATVKIVNTGHTVTVKLASNSNEEFYITGGPLFDSKYEFVQMHIHWGEHNSGSEHKINGYQYAMEMHIVHYKKEYENFENAQNYIDGVCVVAVFGEISPEDNEDMNNFIADFKCITDFNSSIVRNFKEEFSWVQPISLKKHYYTYHGSLTTEPFAECVIWIILLTPIQISKEQLTEFRKMHSSHEGELIKENDRELQMFNNRPIAYVF